MKTINYLIIFSIAYCYYVGIMLCIEVVSFILEESWFIFFYL